MEAKSVRVIPAWVNHGELRPELDLGVEFPNFAKFSLILRSTDIQCPEGYGNRSGTPRWRAADGRQTSNALRGMETASSSSPWNVT